ncbi:MAG: Ppx/GppA family phosphatase [bacterium]|nr:Ppx/GppA family phosphatase [bacterium]
MTEAPPPSSVPTYAAIDLGSNSCRLAIARELSDHKIEIVEAFSRNPRLGEGLKETRILTKKAMHRTLLVLENMAKILKDYTPQKMRCIATQACRTAENSSDFLEDVHRKLGLKFEIINEKEEAFLSTLACSNLLTMPHTHALLIDGGGASTEFVWARIQGQEFPEVIDWISIPYGAVTLCDTYGNHMEDVFDDVKEEVFQILAPFSQKNNIPSFIQKGVVQVVGASGSATTISALAQNLPRYQREKVDGTTLTQEEIHQVQKELFTLSFEGRVKHPCIGTARSDLIIPGLAILQGILKLWPVPKIWVADRSVRDGLLIEMSSAQFKAA